MVPLLFRNTKENRWLTLIPIDSTALLVAGAYTTAPWLILGVVSAVGIGLAVFTLK